jgi:hypothetical protein
MRPILNLCIETRTGRPGRYGLCGLSQREFGTYLATSTWTALTLDTNIYDSYNGHATSGASTEYVAQVAGIYLVIAVSGWAANTTGIRGVAITANGAAVAATSPQVLAPATSSSESIVKVSALIELAVGGYVQGWGYQSSGGALLTSIKTCSLQVIWQHS